MLQKQKALCYIKIKILFIYPVMHMKIFKISIFFLSSIHIIAHNQHSAVIIVPVVDLFFDRLSTYDPLKKYSIKNLYYKTPLASNESKYGCFRSTQALFNDVVTIVEERGEEVCIDVGRVFFDAPDRILLKNFWLHKSALKNLYELTECGIDITIFPEQITLDNPETLSDARYVTLIYPWYDPVTQKKYSAGTRFVKTDMQKNVNTITVHIFEPRTIATKITTIPRKYCFIEKKISNKHRQHLYVSLLKHWITRSNKIIPYVWGGASIIDYVDDAFITTNGTFAGKPISFYERTNMKQPYSGSDCSGLIARAAQIYGIPYFFKNTLTLARHLRPLVPGDILEEGDLLWYPGHVMIVSDIKNNLLIEAAGYPSGYGKVHMIPLHKKYAKIRTYDQLIKHYFNKKKLEILHRNGSVMKVADTFVIYKFSSVWD